MAAVCRGAAVIGTSANFRCVPITDIKHQFFVSRKRTYDCAAITLTSVGFKLNQPEEVSSAATQT